MSNPSCTTCPYDEYSKDGNCLRFKANDNLLVRCAPPWARKKQKAIEVYSGMFTGGMKNKWEIINYIDLFSGPGLCYERGSGEILPGSPMIASNFNYHNLFINDINSDNVLALKSRLNGDRDRFHFWEEDANQIANDINKHLAANSINFCFADPNHMGDLKFSTINAISKNKRVDLLINFAYFMDYKRSVGVTEKKFDEFFGTTKWKEIEEKYRSHDLAFRANALLDLYMEQLTSLGYKLPPKGDEYKNYFLVNTTKNVSLYYLVYASKHIRGYEFCKKMRPYVNQQQELAM